MKKPAYTFILSLFILSTGIAQPEAQIKEKKVPELYGHVFPSYSSFRSSFINTSLQADLGFGTTSPLKIRGVTVGDYELLGFEGQILFFDMNVRYQQRFTPWLALYATFQTGGRLGTDMSTILVDGVNTISGGSIGWLIRIRQTERLNLSGTVNVANLTGNVINVKEYFQDLINNNPDPSVTKRIPAMTLGVGLLGAYAFSPVFGMQFHGEYAYGESFQRQKNEGYYAAGIGGDVNFNPRYNVPLGLALAYTLTSAPQIVFGDGGASNLVSIRVGYTGSDDFELGLNYSFYNVHIQSIDDEAFVGKVMLGLKFYF